MKVYSICYSQSDQVLHYLSFSAVWSGSTLFAIVISLIRVYNIYHSQQADQGLQYLPFFLSCIIKVYTVCHSHQAYQVVDYFPISVWSGSTLVSILGSLISVYTICHSFQIVLSRSILFAILRSLIRVYTICYFFKQYFQNLYCLPFSTVWSGSTLFAILSNQIRIYIIFHSFQAVLSRSILLANLSSLISVCTICNSKSIQGLHYLSLSALSRTTLFAICQQSDEGLHYFWFSPSDPHSQQSDHGLPYLPFSIL